MFEQRISPEVFSRKSAYVVFIVFVVVVVVVVLKHGITHNHNACIATNALARNPTITTNVSNTLCE